MTRTYQRSILKTGLLVTLAGCLMSLTGCGVAINAAIDRPQATETNTPSIDAQPTVIYLVRHAEKEQSSPDPDLSAQGQRRATALARFLANETIDVLLSSDYRRTRATLEPLASQSDLDIGVYDAGDPAALVARVLSRHAGQTVVIAGHSNTVPDLVGRFMSVTGQSADERADLDHDEYERIFVVVRPGRGPATLLELAFSGVSP